MKNKYITACNTCKQSKMNNNKTPYTDEQWKAWYANESSSERFEREQEREKQDEK